MLLTVKFPHEPFNSLVRDGTVGQKMRAILEATRPEAAYFTEMDGQRGAILVVDVEDPSRVPSLAEPWFLNFQADCQLRIVMTPEDLGRSGLEELGKKWG
jgi:hypothetical protein